MILLDLLNIKKDFLKLKHEGIFGRLLLLARENIINYVKKQISGNEKKEAVIAIVNSFILTSIAPVNKLLATCLTVICPIIVQHTYDALKSYIEGLTEVK